MLFGCIVCCIYVVSLQTELFVPQDFLYLGDVSELYLIDSNNGFLTQGKSLKSYPFELIMMTILKINTYT